MQTGGLASQVRSGGKVPIRNQEPEGSGPPPGGTWGLWPRQASQRQVGLERSAPALMISKINACIIFKGDDILLL